jgi:hypothetical protein
MAQPPTKRVRIPYFHFHWEDFHCHFHFLRLFFSRVVPMGARESLQKLADRKTQEIVDLERQIDRARAYLQAIQDSIKALPRETPTQVNGRQATSDLRAGTVLARAREAIQKKGAPMHVNELLVAIGIENTKNARVSLVGSLGAYVRKGVVFTRPGPNTFGLVEMDFSGSETVQEVLPATFGKLAEGD